MKEKIISEWFNAWFDPKWNDFKTCFDKEIYYSESWGPEYSGIEQIEMWFHQWHKQAKLNSWDIKKFIHIGDITIVEWYFSCLDNEKLHEFDGVSIIEWNQRMQIKSLKEYASSLPKYNPNDNIKEEKNA